MIRCDNWAGAFRITFPIDEIQFPECMFAVANWSDKKNESELTHITEFIGIGNRSERA